MCVAESYTSDRFYEEVEYTPSSPHMPHCNYYMLKNQMSDAFWKIVPEFELGYTFNISHGT